MRMKFAAAVLAALTLIEGAQARLDPARIDKDLAKIVGGKGAGDPIAGAALAVYKGGRLVYAGAAGCAEFAADGETCERALRPEMKLRAASISKMVLALGMKPLIDSGAVNVDEDASTYLGWRLRNPNFPDRPITVRQLFSHTSSIRDPEAYWVDAPGRFAALFETDAPFAAADAAGDRGPGAWFTYSNLNFGVLAGVIEGATGERFDTYMKRVVFEPMAIDAGYNWSGVPAPARADGAALHRREAGLWRISVDDASMRAAEPPAFRAAVSLDRAAYLAAYKPGDNPSLFSPQGGLRASVLDLGRLAMALNDAEVLTNAAWRFDPLAPNGETEDEFFAAFGMGVQIVKGEKDFFRNRTIIGHPGEAYGLYSGAWLIRAEPGAGFPDDLVVAFAVTGTERTPPRGVHPSFNAVEESLMRLGMKAAYAAEARAPAPFDEAADVRPAVEAALASAAADGKSALFILGGNWCHDSRALAQRMKEGALATLIGDAFHTVFVDVGRRDRNLWLPRRYGVGPLAGTPTVLIVGPDGALRNAEAVFALTNADSQSIAAITDYFQSYAEKRSKNGESVD